jgi:hypothetical protein
MRTQQPAEKYRTLTLAIREDEREALELHGLSDFFKHASSEAHNEVEDEEDQPPTQ